MTTSVVWIGIGSNLEHPSTQVQQAFDELKNLPRSTLLSHSSLYESEPFGPVKQDNFINAVAAIKTTLNPLELLDRLQAIEKKHHRERKIHWGPRTLDLDILLFGTQEIQTDRLTVPHPFLTERNFVLYPLLDEDPSLKLPSGELLKNFCQHCSIGSLKKLPL